MTAPNPCLPACGAGPQMAAVAALISRAVVGRASVVALVLGSGLTLTNQSGAIFGEQTLELLPIALAYLTPFAVAAASQVLGIRQAQLIACRRRLSDHLQGSFFATALSYGIPSRTVLLALVIGAANTAVVVSATMADGGDLATVSVRPIGQAFVLPMLFGLISQTLSFRRASARSPQED